MKKYSFILIALFVSLSGCFPPPVCDDSFIERKYAETQRKIESISKSHKSGEWVFSLKDSIRLINKYNFNEVKVIYKGETVDKTADGFGKAVWIFRKDTLEIFEGEFKDGTYIGKGVQNYTRGEINEGIWINGKLTGEYVSRYITGTLVKGVYDGSENNKAEIIHGNGDTYFGLVKGDNPNGKGIYSWKTGERFEGLFKFGHKSEGIYYYTDGSKLEIKKDDDIEDLTKSKNLKSEFEFQGTVIQPDVDIHLLAGKIEYPCDAKKTGFAEKVTVKCAIDIDGSIVSTEFLSPKFIPQSIKNSVLNALYAVKFTPLIINGKPVKAFVTAPINFKLRH